MAVAMGQIAPDTTDPQDNVEKFETTVSSDYIRPQHRKLHDPSVSFEEYHYYALLARAEEDELSKKDIGDTTFLSIILPSKSAKGDVVHHSPAGTTTVDGDEKINGSPRNVNGQYISGVVLCHFSWHLASLTPKLHSERDICRVEYCLRTPEMSLSSVSLS
jgi:hypothetical protein